MLYAGTGLKTVPSIDKEDELDSLLAGILIVQFIQAMCMLFCCQEH